jgi:hypothetical protein
MNNHPVTELEKQMCTDALALAQGITELCVQNRIMGIPLPRGYVVINTTAGQTGKKPDYHIFLRYDEQQKRIIDEQQFSKNEQQRRLDGTIVSIDDSLTLYRDLNCGLGSKLEAFVTNREAEIAAASVHFRRLIAPETMQPRLSVAS